MRRAEQDEPHAAVNRENPPSIVEAKPGID
jgi:hypothetical protein